MGKIMNWIWKVRVERNRRKISKLFGVDFSLDYDNGIFSFIGEVSEELFVSKGNEENIIRICGDDIYGGELNKLYRRKLMMVVMDEDCEVLFMNNINL